MREIKLRAWDLEAKEMYLIDDNINCITVKDLLLGKLNEILMQYTGLSDKNGKEIYEGDVLRAKNWSVSPYDERYKDIDRVVTWGDGRWDLRTIKDDRVHSGLELRENNFKRYEVIGNIHESPELLETK